VRLTKNSFELAASLEGAMTADNSPARNAARLWFVALARHGIQIEDINMSATWTCGPRDYSDARKLFT
jgi:hypothetical protein